MVIRCNGTFEDGTRCSKQATFAFDGQRADRCSTHKLQGMINVRAERQDCSMPGCDKTAHWQSFDTKFWCVKHKPEESTNVTYRLCDCLMGRKQYGPIGGSATCCKACVPEDSGYVNLHDLCRSCKNAPANHSFKGKRLCEDCYQEIPKETREAKPVITKTPKRFQLFKQIQSEINTMVIEYILDKIPNLDPVENQDRILVREIDDTYKIAIWMIYDDKLRSEADISRLADFLKSEKLSVICINLSTYQNHNNELVTGVSLNKDKTLSDRDLEIRVTRLANVIDTLAEWPLSKSDRFHVVNLFITKKAPVVEFESNESKFAPSLIFREDTRPISEYSKLLLQYVREVLPNAVVCFDDPTFFVGYIDDLEIYIGFTASTQETDLDETPTGTVILINTGTFKFKGRSVGSFCFNNDGFSSEKFDAGFERIRVFFQVWTPESGVYRFYYDNCNHTTGLQQ